MTKEKKLSIDLVEDDYSDDFEYTDHDNVSKIFVGNVPFQCTKEEFKKCFDEMEGFVNADIIRRHRSKLSRGFGFVVFKDKECAEKLLEDVDIKIKDRTLRFSPYSLENYNKNFEDLKWKSNKSYQIYINNLDSNMNNDQLKKILKCCGEVLSCFISSKNGKTFAIANFKDYNGFKNALQTPVNYNGVNLDIRPYRKTKKYNNLLNKDKNNIFQKKSYQDGFQAGHIVGFQEGFQQGLSAKYLQNYENKIQN